MRRLTTAALGPVLSVVLLLTACSSGNTPPDAGPQATTAAAGTTAPASTTPATSAANTGPAESPPPVPLTGTILFTREFGIDGADGSQLMTVHPDGTGLKELTQLGLGFASDPAWSADGRSILFDLSRDTWVRVYSIPATGGTPTALTHGRFAVHPSASPDGEHIAFARAAVGEDPSSIFVMDVDGTHVARITHAGPGEGDFKPSFSPDGTQIAFIRDGAIEVVNADGSGMREVAGPEAGPHGVHWSPDGTSLVYDDNSLDPPSTAIVNVASGSTQFVDGMGDPSFSPDGSLILGNAFWQEPNGNRYIGLSIEKTDGSDRTLLWHPPPNEDIWPNFPTWIAAD